MPKTIKLGDQVHHDLNAIREKDETFSQAVDRLIQLYIDVGKLVNNFSIKRKEP